jgi:hypothetical protein
VRPGAARRSLPPVAWHLTRAENWPGIRRDGLLSTEALLRRHHPGNADTLLRTHRRAALALPDAVITDQKPMPPAALRPALPPGTTPGQWYALLNGYVFLSLQWRRVVALRGTYLERPMVLMAFDTARVLAASPGAAVTAFNTGSAMRGAAPRSAASFVLVGRWLQDGWASEHRDSPRRSATRPAELVVPHGLPGLDALGLSVRHLAPGEALPPAFVPGDAP